MRQKVDRGELNSARLRVIFEQEGTDKKKQIRQRVDDIISDPNVLEKFQGMLNKIK